LLFTLIKPKEKKDILVSRVLSKMKGAYAKFLTRSFRYKQLVVLGSVAMLVVTVVMASTLNYELIGASDEGTVTVEVDLKPGLQISYIDEMIKPLEEMVAAHPDVERYSVRTGGGGSVFSTSGSASITAYLRENRSLKTAQVVQQWREETKDYVGYNIVVSSASRLTGMMGGSNVEVILQGIDRNALVEASVLVEKIMLEHPGISHISSTATANEPRAEIKVDPAKAAAVGLSPIQVVGSIYPIISGNKATSITNNGREYDVRVEFPADKYRKMADIADIMLATPLGTQVPLTDIAAIEYTTSPLSIYRQDNQYQITVTGQPSPEARFTASDEVRAAIAQMELPPGVSIVDSFVQSIMNEEFNSIYTTIVTAVLLMFMVIAMQFESARFSFVIMVCIPFSVVGAGLLMWITNVTISMTTLMGFLLLFGTVINNGILFIDTADELQAGGMGTEEALVEAGISRMRPILMTSSVTIISVFPESLGIGSSAEIMQGMAVVIIGGLVASTILTLLLLPTFYILFGGGSERNLKKLRRLRAM